MVLENSSVTFSHHFFMASNLGLPSINSKSSDASISQIEFEADFPTINVRLLPLSSTTVFISEHNGLRTSIALPDRIIY